ncbi:hypothetical protein [Roseiarcus fermentans]|uniref:hypothetical protein n=1 Tax=Roseiarcus fermentans TaxID=1473586 RepID=UPI0011BDF477|nr:hypothetical protein [Roseiarcus fermentans]
MADYLDDRLISTVELGDFSKVFEAVLETADNGHLMRLRPPDDATPEQLRRLMQAGSLILTKGRW